jgi:cytochrome b6-f complex iron-sulfur subunit
MGAPEVLFLVIILAAALFLVVATTGGRPRPATGVLSREAFRADRSAPTLAAAPTDLDEEARARFGETTAVERRGGLIRFAPPASVETVGVNRRQFLNRGIVALQSFALGSTGLALIGFLWPSPSRGGFGKKIHAGRLSDILAEIADKKQPVYIPAARAYLNPYPQENLAKAKRAYSESIYTGMEQGIVALYQRCVHLGCRVPWCQTSQWFECPCHGSKYNRVGEKRDGPAPRGLDRFPVDVSSGSVIIDTGIVVQGPPIGTNTTGQEPEGPSCVVRS